MWNFYRLQHAHIHVFNGFRLPQPTKQQTNPHESQNLLSSHSRLLRKLRDTLTFMVLWNHSSLTSMQGQTQTRQNKLHQKLETMTSIWIQAWSKAAQNKTSSAGLGRVPKAFRHLFFLNPTSILQVHEKQGATSWGSALKGAILLSHWRNCN